MCQKCVKDIKIGLVGITQIPSSPLFFNGGDKEDRTPDLLHAMQNHKNNRVL